MKWGVFRLNKKLSLNFISFRLKYLFVYKLYLVVMLRAFLKALHTYAVALIPHVLNKFRARATPAEILWDVPDELNEDSSFRLN
jgi:hypothetical protein